MTPFFGGELVCFLRFSPIPLSDFRRRCPSWVVKLTNLFVKANGHLSNGDFGMAVTFEDTNWLQKDCFAGTTTHLVPDIWRVKGTRLQQVGGLV